MDNPENENLRKRILERLNNDSGKKRPKITPIKHDGIVNHSTPIGPVKDLYEDSTYKIECHRTTFFNQNKFNIQDRMFQLRFIK